LALGNFAEALKSFGQVLWGVWQELKKRQVSAAGQKKEEVLS
jgi:hypothetical protein